MQQCHRTVNRIRDSLEEKKMCASVFLDIEQQSVASRASLQITEQSARPQFSNTKLLHQ